MNFLKEKATMRALLLLVCCLGLFGLPGCHLGQTTMQMKSVRASNRAPQNITVSEALPNFHRLFVEGVLNVVIRTGPPHVVLRGLPSHIQAIKIAVKKDTLYLQGPVKEKKHPVSLTIFVPKLHAFAYRGKGMIRAPYLHTDALELLIQNDGSTILGGRIGLSQAVVEGKGLLKISDLKATHLKLLLMKKANVMMTGMIHLNTLTVDGDGSLNLYWVNNPTLTVRAKGKTQIQLAGSVDKLDVELWGQSRFNGRYLRAKRAFVKTHEHAIASVTTLARQHALALDASDIYFYELPTIKTSFMAKQGSVLDMRDWSAPALEEYKHYNK